MKPYRELSKEELLALQEELQAEYDAEKAKGLNLDISRGKPGKEQLDLSMPMMDVLNGETVLNAENGNRCKKLWRVRRYSGSKRTYGREW